MISGSYQVNFSEDKDTYRLDSYFFQEIITLEKADFYFHDLKEMSRSQINYWITHGYIKVNHKTVKPSHKLKLTDQITWEIPPVLYPEKLIWNDYYEDEDILVFEKPYGLSCHPGSGIPQVTLAHGLIERYGEGTLPGDAFRPGIVHRLDKDTSGVMMIVKNQRAYEIIKEQWKEHQHLRIYEALVSGVPPQDKGTIDTFYGRDLTHPKKFKVIEDDQSNSKTVRAKMSYTSKSILTGQKKTHKISHIECELHTGKTHQIRVQMAWLGCPVLGDLLYGYPLKNFKISRQLLHAHKLGIFHPTTKKWMEFTSLLPKDFTNAIEKVKSMSQQGLN